LPYAFTLGALTCVAVYFLGIWLYGNTLSNWLVYIAKSYQGSLPPDFEASKQLYFIIFAIISVTFSPIGEELLYRGLIHESFVKRMGEQKASIVDSAAFAITHLAHFGILYTITGWEFRFLPALLWMLLMFFTSRVFFYCKQRAGSIYAAVLCHAGFNLAMTYFIFYHIL